MSNDKIKCSSFCKYYKELFCPFSKENNKLEKNNFENPVSSTPPSGAGVKSTSVKTYRAKTT